MFVERLNKNFDGRYSIEEKKVTANGKWAGFLNHDNVNHDSLMIYTGEKITGDKVENYFISTPSDRPWKTELEVFSDSPEVFISYESAGDQVDAENINLLQGELEADINNLIDYKRTNDAKVSDLKDNTTNLSTNKADKTYVDTELGKKYNKEEVYTKQEVLKKVEDLIGAAPEVLNTLGKLAGALDNDPNFATNIINLLAEKVDKIAGKGLSDENYSLIEKNKLSSVEADANNYKHPATHSANMIVENASKRFVSDAEKLEIAKVKNKPDKTYVDSNFATKAEIADAGVGDMLKATYDTNNSGSVDNAEKLGGRLPSEYMKKAPLTWNDLGGV